MYIPIQTSGTMKNGGFDAQMYACIYSQTLLVSTWVSKYSWIGSTHCSVPASYNTIESTLDSKYL